LNWAGQMSRVTSLPCGNGRISRSTSFFVSAPPGQDFSPRTFFRNSIFRRALYFIPSLFPTDFCYFFFWRVVSSSLIFRPTPSSLSWESPRGRGNFLMLLGPPSRPQSTFRCVPPFASPPNPAFPPRRVSTLGPGWREAPPEFSLKLALFGNCLNTPPPSRVLHIPYGFPQPTRFTPPTLPEGMGVFLDGFFHALT